jgi:hypothetical protein
LIALDWEKFWEDTWETFSFDLNWLINFKWGQYKINSDFSHFTTWEVHSYWKNWKINFYDTSFDDATRIDYFHGDIQKLMSNEKNWNFQIKRYLGWWIDSIWDFGWEEIQEAWHEMNAFYKNKAEQEDVFWISPTINASADIKSILVWDNQLGVYAYGNINAQLALIQEYWKSSADGTVWFWVNYWRLWVEISNTLWFQNLPDGSKTMNRSWLNGFYNSSSLELKAPIPLLENSSISYMYTNSTRQDYMSVNYIYKF